jgi:drug/metabolite transporter (DMT)-like permease
MVYLLLSILFSSCLPLLLRAFASWRVSLVVAITLNYLVCVVVGVLLSLEREVSEWVRFHSWTLPAVLQGVFLAGNFYLLAFTAQRSGVSIAALSSRLSVAIPVVLAIPLYGDRLSLINGLGAIGALVALVLASAVTNEPAAPRKKRSAWLPVVVFFSFGLQFALLKFVQHFFLVRNQHHDYLTASFFFALLVSLCLLIVTHHPAGSIDRIRSLLGGIALGACNYCALFALTRVLSVDGWQSAMIFPTYSVGVVVVSTLGAMVLFAERLSARHMVGIGIGLVSVAMLNL